MNSLNFSPDKDFPFAKVSLGTPQGLQGGAYFSKIRMEVQPNSYEPMLIQTPKCLTKNGVHKTEKKIYCDLMFLQDDEVFLEWVRKLEERIQNLIYEKRTVWFHNEMDYDTIDYHWQHALRVYKGSKHLLRCHVQRPKSIRGKQLVQVYDEEERTLTLDDIKQGVGVISILEVLGLKFTTQSFTLEFCLRQVMVLKNRAVFNKCLIRQAPLGDETEVTDELSAAGEKGEEEGGEEGEEGEEEGERDETDIHTEDTEATNQCAEDPRANDLAEEAEEGVHDENPSEKHTATARDEIDMETDASVERLADPPGAAGATEADGGATDKAAATQASLAVADVSDAKIRLVVKDATNLASSGNADESSREDIETRTASDDASPAVGKSSLEKNDELTVVDLRPAPDSDPLVLKKPNEVYLEIYRQARRKAKEARKKAILAYLEAKKIKSAYLLDDVESSDDDLDNYSDVSELSET